MAHREALVCDAVTSLTCACCADLIAFVSAVAGLLILCAIVAFVATDRIFKRRKWFLRHGKSGGQYAPVSTTASA
jgi:hypothetical protein